MSEARVPQQQQSVIITAAGGPDVLRLGTVPVPVPGPKEVLIKVAAAGVNRHDCNQRRARLLIGRLDNEAVRIPRI